MNDVAIARALHVMGVVLWIGGVAMVTSIVLPVARRMKTPEQQLAFFEAVEGRFAWQARLMTLVVGLSGLYMVWRFELWDRFREGVFWWMHAMVALWLIFTVMLFVAEPLFLHAWFRRRVAAAPARTLWLAQLFHWILLILSLIVIAGAVAGSHGLSITP